VVQNQVQLATVVSLAVRVQVLQMVQVEAERLVKETTVLRLVVLVIQTTRLAAAVAAVPLQQIKTVVLVQQQ
jgi:hypothetical protein